MKQIKQNTVHVESFTPEPRHLASAAGNHGVDVVATTAIILFFEAASNNLVSPYFEPEELSVGTHVNVDHVAPAFSNRPITVTAVLEKQQGRRLEFDLVARQGETVVMSGKHHRAVATRGKFSRDQKQELGVQKQIDFWFDFHSPWCYFASHRIGDIAREFNATLNWKPVHLANLSTAVDGRQPLKANSRFVAWYQQDQRDTAEMLDLPFDPHKQYPKRPSRALRASIYAADKGLAEAFVKLLMQGYWAEQQDISDIQWLKQIGESVGLNGDELETAAIGDEYKHRLGQNLEQAIEQNLFGLPVSLVRGKIFWGNDRLDLLSQFLEKLS